MAVTEAKVIYSDRYVVGDRELLSIHAVAVGWQPTTAEVVVAGELCPSSSPTLAEVLEALLDDGVGSMHVDVSMVELCTSAGVDALTEVRDRLEAGGGRMTITGARGVVRRVLEITDVGIDD
jgi:anti-anti-sigma factor